MTIGPGKYDAEAMTVMESAKAKGVILIVIGGDRGEGFSVVATPEVTWALPDMLRSIAKDVEVDLGNIDGTVA